MAEKKIGGRTFRVGHVLATDAIKLQVRLLKIIGGGVDRLPVILDGMGEKGRADPEAKARSDAAAVAALGDIFSKSDENQIAKLMSDIVSMSQINNPSGSWETADIDQDFTTQKADLFPVIVFVIQEVLGDFFGAALANGKLKSVLDQAKGLN